MGSTSGALVWELVWKNRLVVPALGLLLGLGALCAYALPPAGAGSGGGAFAGGTVVASFLASLLLGFAPFTLMETQRGWRMNSMVTRWFALPVRTSVLVLLPMVVGCSALALLMAGWTPVLHRLAGEFDATFLLVVMVAGVALIQALAWLLPRRPGQYWPLVGLLFPVLLLAGLIPPDAPGWAGRRTGAIGWVLGALPVIAAGAWYAAARNRCGDWAGGLPLDRVWARMLGDAGRRRAWASPRAALFWGDTLKLVRVFGLTWMVFAVVIVAGQCGLFRLHRSDLALSPRLVVQVALQLLPFFGAVWLAAGGLPAGCEFGAGFRTRFSSLRSTLPVGAGELAGQRVATVVGMWLLVWLPLVAGVGADNRDLFGVTSPEAQRQLAAAMARWMSVSASLVVGALPLFLWGRLDGFPNLLLGAIVSWSVPWWLSGFLGVEEPTARHWMLASGSLAAKLGLAGWAWARAWRAGATTWRYGLGLLGGWLAVAVGLVWGLPTWRMGGAWDAMAIVVYLPLARLAWCPLAVQANRHR